MTFKGVGASSVVLLGVLASTMSAERHVDRAAAVVSVATDGSPGAPVEHGLDEIARALAAKGSRFSRLGRSGAATNGSNLKGDPANPTIVAGLSRGDGPAARLLRTRNLDPPADAESLLISRIAAGPRETWLVTAPDDRGLMYALLDVADRIRWSASPAAPLSEVRETRESPAVAERAISIYTMQRAWFERRFFDRAYWERYFDLLARCRYNSFVLIFGYENGGYFAPAYPYFFDVDGFPHVHVAGFTGADQQRYREALRQLIALAHARGLGVTLGLWDHIYRGGVQAGGMDAPADRPQPGVPVGLTPANLMAYSQAALAKLVETFPAVDALQFRMHTESGLKTGEMHDFWKGIYAMLRQRAPHMRVDARAKDLPDELIDLALDMGVNLRISTKYWAEQMGLPFHPTHINRQNQFDRRHGYADLLRYPKRYDVSWQLWNGGTARVLLWGDPDYARRFAASTHLYDGAGYEVNEMLATKMEAQPHDMAPFELLAAPYRYYDYEFERYWHFYQVFGRVGYNPDTPAEVWHREFERRFGRDAAPHVERALHRASWILPMITAYNFPYNRFPTTRGWPEKQRREDLPEYAHAEPSDTEQFLGMTQAARLIVAGEDSPKIWPPQSSRWFARAADDVLREVADLESLSVRAGGAPQRDEWHGEPRPSQELASTLVDLKILAHLARYHSRRTDAGLAYALFEQTGDVSALDRAIAFEKHAIDAWRDIVHAAADVYAPNLRMGLAGAGLSGHWRDELDALERGLVGLERQRQDWPARGGSASPARNSHAPLIAHVPIRKLKVGEDLIVDATVTGPRPIARVHIAYQVGDRFGDAPLERTGPMTYRARVPASRLGASFRYIIHATDESGRAATWPVVSDGQPGRLVIVSNDEEPPRVQHAPVATAPAGRPLRIVARVADPSGVKWVRLRFRSVNQHDDYKMLDMRPTGAEHEYAAVVPGAAVDSKFDFMYFIEVMDNVGNGAVYPDLLREQPYVIVRLDRDAGSLDRGGNFVRETP